MSKRDPSYVQFAIQFSERLLEPQAWIRQAEELFTSATVLEAEVRKYWEETELSNGRVTRTSSRPSVQAAHSMLIAYAIENYFKAVIVSRSGKRLQNRLLDKLPDGIKGHDLGSLARRVGWESTLQEEDLLARLTRNSIWSARYPVPTGPNLMRAMQQYSDGNAYFIAYLAPGDIDQIHDLARRIRTFVDSELAKSV